MLQYLLKVAILAIFFILLGDDSAVSAQLTVCEERAICEKNYTALESILDSLNDVLFQNFTQFVDKLRADTRLRQRIEKFTHELDNPCDFMPLKGRDLQLWPYQAAKWLGYIYNTSTYMIYYYTTPYTEIFPTYHLIKDCKTGLIICREAYDFMVNYLARKQSLARQIQKVNSNGLTNELTKRVNKLQQQLRNRTECPQDRSNPTNCPLVLDCTSEYQLRQRQLEDVLDQEYLVYVKYYEEQGKQKKLKEQLAVLIKQNSSDYAHCAIRPSSGRNFTSPYEGLFYYAFKNLHVSPSGCTRANKNLPPVPGNKRCDIMYANCRDKLKDAIEMIEEEKKALRCLTDLTANETSYTALLKKLIENLEKDVKQKINSNRCITCPDVAPCHKEYLELQKTLNKKNQEIQNEYLEKFERQDQEAINREKIPRMITKIRDDCGIMPLSYFKNVYPSTTCYWRSYLFGISLEQPTHCLAPNFDKLPDLTVVRVECTLILAECNKRLEEGKALLARKEIELEQLRTENNNAVDIEISEKQFTDVEKRYIRVAGTFCPFPFNGVDCDKLLECKTTYNGAQERFDDARTLFLQNIVDYGELSGFSDQLKTVDLTLNQQLGERCETIPEIPRFVIKRPYLAPHEDSIKDKVLQLDFMPAHASNSADFNNCTMMLQNCTRQLTTATNRISGTKSVAKYYFEFDKGKCSVLREIEYGIIRKTIALRELTSQNQNCFRVTENDKIITYLYNKESI